MRYLARQLVTLVCIFCSINAYTQIRGNIDGISSGYDGYYIYGWACDSGRNHSIQIHLYSSNRAGKSVNIIKGASANLKNEPEVNSACSTSGVSHRFNVKLTPDEIKLFKNKPIYIYGISLSGGTNHAIGGSGAFKMPNPSIKGIIDGTTQYDSFYITGWACDTSIYQSIDIHIYAGGPEGKGSFIKSAKANEPSESGVEKACDTKNTPHRFSVELTRADIAKAPNQPIYIYGLSTSEGLNLPIHQSGSFNLPSKTRTSDIKPNSKDDLIIPGEIGLSDIKPNSEGDLIIPENTVVTIDRNVSARFLKISGRLQCPVYGNHKISADGIMVNGQGAELRCGTKNKPFAGVLDIELKGNKSIASHSGVRALMVMNHGTINLHSESDHLSKRVRLNRTVAPGATSIYLDKGVEWSAGQEIVITTTSFNTKENERRTIRRMSDDKKTVYFDNPLKFRHHGETKRFSNDTTAWTVDQRAYVINIDRKISIYSVNDSIFKDKKIGAHVMVMVTGKAFLRGVGFDRVGQMGILGRYPFHWHSVGDASGQYVKNSVVVDSMQRCYTVHQTINATLDNNACYNHFSHGYFLEDGSEFNNRITNNIAILSKKPPKDKALLISDFSAPGFERSAAGPSGFWISHPTNTVTGNVSVASEGSGFWMSFARHIPCDHPGCSASQRSNKIDTRTQPTTAFNNNEASTNVVGMTWDAAINLNSSTNNPLNPMDFNLTASRYLSRPTFLNLVAYKSTGAGIYYRGDTAIFDNAILADNSWSAFMAYNQSLTNSLIVAKSSNYDTGGFSNPLKNTSLIGIVQYDGPFDLNNTHFQNFSETKEYNENGKEVTSFPIDTVGGAEKFTNIVRKATFKPNPIEKVKMRKMSNWADVSVTSLRDLNKTLDYYAPGDERTLFRPDTPFNKDDSCVETQSSVDAIRCDYNVAVLKFGQSKRVHARDTDFKVVRFNTRTGLEDASFQRSSDRKHFSKFSVIVSDKYRYHVRDIDVSDPNGFGITYQPEVKNELSPLISFSNFIGRCTISTMSVTNLQEYPSVNRLVASQGAGYVRDLKEHKLIVRFTTPDETRLNNPTPGVRGGVSPYITFLCP